MALDGAAQRFWPASPRSWKVLLAVGAVVTVVPILAIAAFRPLTTPSATEVPVLDQYVPANTFPVTAKEEGDGSVLLSWPSQNEHGSRVAYEIFREPTDGLECTLRRHAAALCTYYTDYWNSLLVPLAQTARTSFRDHPSPGPWVYRIAATISPGGPVGLGNFMLLSRAAKLTESSY